MNMRRNNRWTIRDERYLEFAYSTTELDELAKELGRTKMSIYMKAFELGLTKKWTDEDLNYLKEAYSTTSIDELAVNLGRSGRAIKSKAFSLGLTKRPIKKDVECSEELFGDLNEIESVIREDEIIREAIVLGFY